MRGPQRKRAPTRRKSEQKRSEPAAEIDIDPYFDWVEGAGKPNYFLPGRQQKWMPILVKLVDATPQEFAGGFFDLVTELELHELWKNSVKVPELYTQGPIAEDKHSYCAAIVASDVFRSTFLKHQKVREKIATIELSLPLDRESLPDDFFQ